MLIADATITKEYWEPVFVEIQKMFEKGSYKKVRGQDVFKMTIVSTFNVYLTYVAARVEDGEFVVFGWVLLEHPKHRWESYQVAQSYVFKCVRGQGWAKLIYDVMINVEKLILASGDQQSRSARDFWKGLVKSERFHIWAHDFANLDVYEPVIYDEENDEVWSILPIYQDHKKHRRYIQDIRLIAIKKV